MHSGQVKPSLIFDLDGTLVDSLPGIAASLNHSLEKQGLNTHPPGVVRTYIGNGMKKLVERAAPQADPADLNMLLEAFKTHYTNHWIKGTHVYNGINYLLKELQGEGYQMAVLSNKVHHDTQTIVRKLLPSVHFALIQGQENGIPLKPNPAGAQKVAHVFGRNTNDCILIGDSVADVETAKNADMRFVGVTWGYQDRLRLREAGADHFIEAPADLPPLIRAIQSDIHA